ncbi:hypothetical protein ACHAXS_000223, partial [Conticribra weissflogii]
MDQGAVYIYEYKVNDIFTGQYKWIRTQTLTQFIYTGREKFGQSVSLCGEFLVVGSNGEVNIYRRPIGSDGFQDFNHPYRSDEDGNFGHAVAVDEDGNFAVGAPGERSGQGSIHVYKRVGKS